MQHGILKLLLVLVVLVIAGCGFHLRGTTHIPHQLQKLLLDSYDPYGPLTHAIRQQLHLNKVTIVDEPMRKDLHSLRIIHSTENQSTVSIFQDGKTAEYQLKLVIQAQVLIPGQDIYPLTTTVFRSFFDNPLTALAKDAENEIIKQEMREQAAQQLVRKLLSVQAAEDEKNRNKNKVNKLLTGSTVHPLAS